MLRIFSSNFIMPLQNEAEATYLLMQPSSNSTYSYFNNDKFTYPIYTFLIYVDYPEPIYNLGAFNAPPHNYTPIPTHGGFHFPPE